MTPNGLEPKKNKNMWMALWPLLFLVLAFQFGSWQSDLTKSMGITQREGATVPKGLMFTDEQGAKKEVVMGSYGIGISRLMGVIVEKFNDENGILWPESVAPFQAHLLALGGADGEKIYKDLQHAGIEVLYDDRDVSAGVKFAEADLIGIPWRIVTSAKLGEGMVEVKKRDEKDAHVIPLDELLTALKNS